MPAGIIACFLLLETVVLPTPSRLTLAFRFADAHRVSKLTRFQSSLISISAGRTMSSEIGQADEI